MEEKYKFYELLNRWERETIYMSSVGQKSRHPAFVEIVEMGESVIPLIFESLINKPSHIFSALYEITGENPIPEEDRGKIMRSVQHWVKWGEEKGYVDV